MPVFEYRGFDKGGKAIAGIVDADNAKVARVRLRKQGMFPTDLNEQAKGGGAVRGSGLSVEIDFSKYFQFVSNKDMSVLMRQLSTLISASVPIAESLNAVIEQAEKPKLKIVLSEVKERVNEGSTLADALGKHPSMFDNLTIQMVRAGESSGALAEVFERLADYAEAQVKLRGKLIGALLYPMIMGFVGMAILFGLFWFVIPQMRELLDSVVGADNMPYITRLVFAFGYLFHPCVCCPAPFLIAGGAWGFSYWARTSGRRLASRMRLAMPLFGRLARQVAVARFCRTLATLLVSGVPILNALAIVKAVMGNVLLEEAVESAAHNITEGQSIAQPLKSSGQFPPLVVHMIAIGEKTGELEKMLLVVADSYESEVEQTLDGLTAVLGPVMIIALGATVLFVAVGLLYPLSMLAGQIATFK